MPSPTGIVYSVFCIILSILLSQQEELGWHGRSTRVSALAISLCCTSHSFVSTFFFLPFHMQVPEEKDKLGHRNNDIP